MIRTLDANYLSTFHLSRPASGPAPFHLSSGPVLRVLLGIGWGLQITTDDNASSPTRLNQRRVARERRVRGHPRLETLYMPSRHFGTR